MKKNKEKNKTIYYILFGIIILCGIYIVYSNKLLEIRNSNIQYDNQVTRMSIQETIEEQEENIIEEQEKNEVIGNEVEKIENKENDLQQQTNIKNETEIPAQMGGYEVLGKLVIEKVNISKNILSISNDNSLKVSVTKLYGPDINQVGNFCICGHNWKSMLKRALKLKIDDTFYLIDRATLNKVNYKIYNIYTCMPKELECLNQNTNGKKEVTIITCNPGGVTRLIIKAREI